MPRNDEVTLDAIARETLRELIAEQGADIAEDSRRCEAFLRDLCPQAKREITLLVTACKEGIPTKLRSSSKTHSDELIIEQLSQHLQKQVLLTPDAARWAVVSWAYAIGLISAPEDGPVTGSQASSEAAGAYTGGLHDNTVRQFWREDIRPTSEDATSSKAENPTASSASSGTGEAPPTDGPYAEEFVGASTSESETSMARAAAPATKKKRPLWRRFMRWAATICVLAVAGVAILAYVGSNRSTSSGGSSKPSYDEPSDSPSRPSSTERRKREERKIIRIVSDTIEQERHGISRNVPYRVNSVDISGRDALARAIIGDRSFGCVLFYELHRYGRTWEVTNISEGECWGRR